MTLSPSVDLDPALVDPRTYATRRRRHLVDTPYLLSLVAVFACVIPAGQIVPQLTDLGRPTTLVALLLAVMWAVSRLHPRMTTRGPQPMRWVVMFYVVAVLLSYVAGLARGMPTIEANGADRALLATAALVGPMLAFADGVPNRSRLDAVLRALVYSAAIMAFIAIVQSSLRFDLLHYIKIPGLSSRDYGTGVPGEESARDGVASTATHYIEFGTIMAMTLPFAVHVARFSGTRTQRQLGAVSAALIFMSIPMAVSRTAILALAIVLLVMIPTLTWRMRFNLGVPMLALVMLLFVVRPGLLGSVRSLFTSWGHDDSIKGRTDDYSIVGYLFSQRPWLGRGQGTFIPTQYIFLDNQWLGHAISGGIVGIAALAALHVTAIVLAAIAMRRSSAVADRSLCACLITVQLVAIAVEYTFDALAFTTFVAVFSLLTGCAGAAWRLLHRERDIRTVAVGRAE
ncbi:O-antigen ligase family protein [Micromonospora costi]|uniref:O-antigen ligase family protein n=1 Tax=Micromonospora costi TaxID=1530042 RepID=UPI003403CD7C